MFAILGARNGDVLDCCLRIDSESLRNLYYPFWAERTLRVCNRELASLRSSGGKKRTDIRHSTRSTTLLLWKLSHHAKGVSQLSLSTSVLAIDLVDAL